MSADAIIIRNECAGYVAANLTQPPQRAPRVHRITLAGDLRKDPRQCHALSPEPDRTLFQDDAAPLDDPADNLFRASRRPIRRQARADRGAAERSQARALARILRDEAGNPLIDPRHASPTRGDRARLRQARAAVCAPDVAAPESMHLRIAAQTINLTLLLTMALPVGAAALTYGLFRGQDMRLTSRLATLTGLMLAAFGPGGLSGGFPLI
jgi:hypothetical protein